MIASHDTLSPFDTPRAALARLCREICVARELSPSNTTAPIETELSAALAAIQSAHGPDSVHENDLLDLFRAEQLRVNDANLLAELLVPKLAAYLRTHGLSNPPFAPAASAPAPRSPAPAPLSASSPLPAAPAGPPGIADLLDGMLEQDRHDERTRRTGARR